jgi:hypothetical protein
LPESTLSLQLSDLASEIGNYLGFGRTATSWTGWNAANPYVPQSITVATVTVGAQDTQLGQIMAVVSSGCRQFYYPPLTDDMKVSYKWGFLTPERQINIIAGQTTYDLPDDYAGMEGEMTFQSTDSTWITVKRVGQGLVYRALQQQEGITLKPTMCAVIPKQSDGASGQRYQVIFAPIPDNSYTLNYKSNILPNALSYSNPFPYGGMTHADTIRESCLAVAERDYNDEPNGTHNASFRERLQASVSADVREYKPEYFGYNADRSDRRRGGPGFGYSPWGNDGNWFITGATYDGTQY